MKRCAIYTRKSTEEGLEQDFNSLHAQREACEAFIKSQKHEGWKLHQTQYDDGGHSGGTLDRPALRQLLAAIDRGEIDVVVVYKVDRLTRSLADFAKIVERFDERGVSFVSVTQQFNTTSSMGRLTLNVLLSFAQFEREVTAERIRDKIAASKKKGMWMGGAVPLGYDNRDKRLVVNPEEAMTVRAIFDLYIEHGSVSQVQFECRRRGLVTKRRRSSSSSETGGHPFSRGHLYKLLANRLYVGEIVHGDAIYPGQHDAIVDAETFEAARRLIKSGSVGRRSTANAETPSPLAGLIHDETGDPLAPTHASKKGRRYRYYVSKRLMSQSTGDSGGWRLPAQHIEQSVGSLIAEFLRDRGRLLEALKLPNATPDRWKDIFGEADNIAEKLTQGAAENRDALMKALVLRITVTPEQLRLRLSRAQILEWLSIPSVPTSASDDAIDIGAAVRLRRRGVEAKLIVEPNAEQQSEPDRYLVELVARAVRWFEEIGQGRIGSIQEIAQREDRDPSDIGRELRFAFLAPDIVEAILAGRQPVELTARRLRHLGSLPSDWQTQREILGFTA